MKAIQLVDLLRSIFKSFFLFLCICMVTSLGTVAYCGLSYTEDGLNDMADRYFASVNCADLKLYAPLGFSDAEAQSIKAQFAQITDIQLCYSADELFYTGDGELAARISDIPSGMNAPTLLTGRLPSAPDECLIETATAKRFGLKEGDTLRLSRPSGALKTAAFIICGTATFPEVIYINDAGGRCVTELADGEVSALIAVDSSAFDPEYFTDAPYCCLTLDTTLGVTTEGYSDYVAAAREEILAYAETLQLEKFGSLSEEYESELDSAQTEYDRSLEAYNKGVTVYETNEQKLKAAKEKLDKALTSLKQYEGTSEYVKYKTQYDASAAEYAVSAAQLEAYAENLSDSEDALYTANREITAAKTLLGLLKRGYVNAETLSDNYSFNIYSAGVDTISAVINSCSVLFLCVALLVVYTTVSRMVTDDSRLIGTQKALGFSSSRIRAKYVAYSVICTLFGICGGVLFSYYRMQLLIYSAGYRDVYYITDYALAFDWVPVIIITVLELAAAVTAAYIACRRLTKQSAVALMNSQNGDGDEKRAARNRKPREKLPFGFSVTLRNIFTDRKMLWTTVIGVAGCLILLISTINARFAVTSAIDVQYGEIQKYDGTAVLSGESVPAEKAEFEKMLSSQFVVDSLNVSENYGMFETDTSGGYLTYICPAQSGISAFISLRDVKTGAELPVPESGVLVSCKAAEECGLKVGDAFYILDVSGVRYATTVAGIFEWHLGSAAVISPAHWQELTGRVPEMTQYYIRLLNTDASDLVSAAETHGCFLSYTDANTWEKAIQQRLVGYDQTILIISFLSFVLSIFVIFNLANMNITRKMRELTVMKTVGFSTRHLCNYVFAENMLMSVAGLAVGAVSGSLIAWYIASSVETSGVYNVRAVFPQAVIIGMFITFVFYTAANLISLLAIRRIKMTQMTRS